MEVIKLFEPYRIVYPSKHQFLGDLFEQLLNQGFKQNEGQFFTPIPITRFIWESLPLENLESISKPDGYPRIIDYACGSGHFLTEGIDIINELKGQTSNEWVRENIFGIEKDYRLARVSKISLFMNGAGDGNIIFGDGLDNHKDKGIENNTFDILVANPPYSVRAFKSHLELKENDFELTEFISNEGSEIEVLFVERIAQLLKPNGIAAVILPSSILSNTSNSYIGARDAILKNFKIKAISQFADKTFGATDTSTIILFLQKYDEPPKHFKIIEDTVQAIFNDQKVAEWQDNEILEDYIDHIGVDKNLYINFLEGSLDYKKFREDEYFKMYVNNFEKSTELRNMEKLVSFNNLSIEEQNIKRNSIFYANVKEVEKEKLYYFDLIRDQETLVIKAPTTATEQYDFLGYKWSNRKGSEGIQIRNLGGKLYSPENRNSQNYIAPLIRNIFRGNVVDIEESLKDFVNVIKTKNMLEFEREKMDKSISLNKIIEFSPTSSYPIKNLEDLYNNSLEIQKGTAITKDETKEGDYKVVAGGISFAYYNDKFNRDEEVITVSASGANAGYVNYWNEKIFASDCTTIQSKNKEITKYVYYYLKAYQDEIFKLAKGSAQPHVYPSDIKRFKIPEVPLLTQEKIIAECEKLEEKYENTRMKIEDYKAQIQQIFENLEVIKNGGGGYRLSDSSIFNLSIGKRVLQSQLTEKGIPVYSANVFESVGNIDEHLIDDFSIPYIVWGIDGDWMVNIFEKGYAFYPTDHCGFMTVDESEINPRYMAYLLEKAGKSAGFSRSHRASIDRIKSLMIGVPNIEIQNQEMNKIYELEEKIRKLEENQIDLNEEISDTLNMYLQ